MFRRPDLHPVPVPKHNTGIQLSTICNCHPSSLGLIWTPRVRMLNLRLPFQQTTDLPPSSHPPPERPAAAPDPTFWNTLTDLTGSSLPHGGTDRLLRSSGGGKASALTQTLKL